MFKSIFPKNVKRLNIIPAEPKTNPAFVSAKFTKSTLCLSMDSVKSIFSYIISLFIVHILPNVHYSDKMYMFYHYYHRMPIKSHFDFFVDCRKIAVHDTKAGLVLGSAGIILSLLTFFGKIDLNIYEILGLIITAILLSTTIFFSVLTIFPRITKKNKSESAIFYKSIIQQTN